MAAKLIPYAAAAVLAVIGAQAASAQVPVVPVPNAFGNFHVPPPTPPVSQYQPNYGMPAFAQPMPPPPQPMVVVPFNAFGPTIR
jgi:hypothetical protein